MKISIREKIGYGLGDTASCLFWQTISFYLLFFYTDVFGLDPLLAGIMISSLRLADAFVDPAIGMIADRTSTRHGKFRPYLLWFAVPLSVSAILTFSTPDFMPTGKLIYAYLTYGLFMIFYSAINIPYSSMLGVISSDPAERTSLSSFKYIGAYAGGFIVSLFLLPLTKHIGGNDVARGWQYAMIIFSALAVGLFLITFLSTRERVQPMKSQSTTIGLDIKDLFTNRPWLLLLLMSLTMILFIACRLNIITYYFKYYVGKQVLFNKTYGYEELTAAFNTIGMVFSILGVVSLPFVTRSFGKRKTFLFYLVFALAATGGFYFLRPGDLFAMMVLQALITFACGTLPPLIWSMYADTADYGEWKNNRRATGLVFSAAIFAQKIGWALGTAFTGWFLKLFGFTANVEQNAHVKELIRELMSTIPVAIGVLSVILVLFYKLDERKMKAIEQDLAERKQQ
jgi:glycoside/pentoside/hexuronide:cation symporter, GPH family